MCATAPSEWAHEMNTIILMFQVFEHILSNVHTTELDLRVYNLLFPNLIPSHDNVKLYHFAGWNCHNKIWTGEFAFWNEVCTYFGDVYLQRVRELKLLHPEYSWQNNVFDRLGRQEDNEPIIYTH